MCNLNNVTSIFADLKMFDQHDLLQKENNFSNMITRYLNYLNDYVIILDFVY